MLENLNKLKNNTEKKIQVSLIRSRLRNLKEEIKEMSEDETENEKPDEIVNLADKILEFNNQNQEEQGLKILKPNKMLNTLPITLGQLKAGNNSEKKLKNEIERQLLYSLHHSKKLTKTIYNNLINTI